MLCMPPYVYTMHGAWGMAFQQPYLKCIATVLSVMTLVIVILSFALQLLLEQFATLMVAEIV